MTRSVSSLVVRAAVASTAQRLRDLRGDERGNVLIYVTVTAAVLMGMAGLALDISRATITHSEAQAAADGAALAGASQLDGTTSACTWAKSMATNVANRQRFAVGGAANVTIASGSPRCLSDLPASDGTAIGGQVTTSGPDSRFIEVTTQQLTHRNSFLDAVSGQKTAAIQRSAVAGFRRSLCAPSPVMLMCDSVAWRAGGAFDAWRAYANNEAFACPGCNSATDVQLALASLTPQFCVNDAADPASSRNASQAVAYVNTRFGSNSTAARPSDTNVMSYPRDIASGTPSWNCLSYWTANHASDGLAKPGTCTSNTTALTRYAVYQLERAAGRIPTAGRPPAGTPTTPQERRLIYLAILGCDGDEDEGDGPDRGGRPQAFLKAFMIAPVSSSNGGSQFVEALGLITSKTDPNVLHEEVQLYR